MGHLMQFVFTHRKKKHKDNAPWPQKSCRYCKNCPMLIYNFKTEVLYADCEIWDADPIKEGHKGTCKYFELEEENKNV